MTEAKHLGFDAVLISTKGKEKMEMAYAVLVLGNCKGLEMFGMISPNEAKLWKQVLPGFICTVHIRSEMSFGLWNLQDTVDVFTKPKDDARILKV